MQIYQDSRSIQSKALELATPKMGHEVYLHKLILECRFEDQPPTEFSYEIILRGRLSLSSLKSWTSQCWRLCLLRQGSNLLEVDHSLAITRYPGGDINNYMDGELLSFRQGTCKARELC